MSESVVYFAPMVSTHVIFDGFGTLVERQRPMSFYAHMKCTSSVPIQWEQAMTTTFAWNHWAQGLGLEQELLDDLESIALYNDIPKTLAMLSSAGVGFSIMSNLASCYGAPLQKALVPFCVQHWFLSYRDGMKKPDPRYYAYALATLGLVGKNVIFVGDHAKHDVLGPALSGFNAMRIRRDHMSMYEMLRPWC